VNERANPFASLAEPPEFKPKPRRETPGANDAIERIAEEHNFPSREARKAQASSKRKPRIYRTGRNRHFGIKATPETVERFYKAADARKVPLGLLLELALDALEGPNEGDMHSGSN
jgi:hypothetical protein